MTILTLTQLTQIYRESTLLRCERYLAPLIQTMQEFQINTPQRIYMFLAQIGHESGQLRYVKELASGAAYEGRVDLGNTEPGDGVKYKGRGLIQITGKKNYALAGLALDLPLLEKPELLEEDLNACRSAGWFWKNNNLNSFCDKDDFRGLTKAINGGYNGWEDRVKLLNRAKEVMQWTS